MPALDLFDLIRSSRLLLLLALLSLAARAQKIAITFDDLPAHGDLPHGVSRLQVAQSVLRTLKQQKMPPVYGFINGIRIEQVPADSVALKAWRDAGQPLGSHTWSHPDLAKLSPAEFEADIQKDEPLLRKYMAGGDWRWLRYPYLQEGDTPEKAHAVRAWLRGHDYKVAEVSMSFGDYLWNPPYARCMAKGDVDGVRQLHDSYLAAAAGAIGTYRAISQNLYGRDIPYVLLLHIGAFDAHMLPELLNLYRKQGFTFVSLPEAEQDRAYTQGPESGLPGGGGINGQTMAAHHLQMPGNAAPDALLNTICR